jgi:cytochrome c553
MKAHARGYTDEQMRQISTYLSQQRSSSTSR